jgi:integrase
MRRENVDFDKAVWTHTGSMTKNKERLTIPLSGQIIDILKSLPKIGDTFRFTTMSYRPFLGLGRPRDHIAEAAGVTDWR